MNYTEEEAFNGIFVKLAADPGFDWEAAAVAPIGTPLLGIPNALFAREGGGRGAVLGGLGGLLGGTALGTILSSGLGERAVRRGGSMVPAGIALGGSALLGSALGAGYGSKLERSLRAKAEEEDLRRRANILQEEGMASAAV